MGLLGIKYSKATVECQKVGQWLINAMMVPKIVTQSFLYGLKLYVIKNGKKCEEK